MSEKNLSEKDEALLILEYLENERMSKTFLTFLDESKHLYDLRTNLYNNYEHPDENNNNNNTDEVKDFQTFFNFSKQNECFSNKNSHELLFDEEFLNDLISQTPPMDHTQHDLPDTPLPSTADIDDVLSIEQLFATQHDTPNVQLTNERTMSTSYTKCIVVTQDYLQSMYNQSSNTTNNNINFICRPKRRRRRLKKGKENVFQQRKIMPRTI